MTTMFYFDGLTKQNSHIQYITDLGEDRFTFDVRWNTYNECAFLTILDGDGEEIIAGVALRNNLVIRKRELPYMLLFANVNDDTYEPTLDTISTDFAMYYEDNQ